MCGVVHDSAQQLHECHSCVPIQDARLMQVEAARRRRQPQSRFKLTRQWHYLQSTAGEGPAAIRILITSQLHPSP